MIKFMQILPAVDNSKTDFIPDDRGDNGYQRNARTVEIIETVQHIMEEDSNLSLDVISEQVGVSH